MRSARYPISPAQRSGASSTSDRSPGSAKQYRSSATIFSEGEPGDKFYLVIEGAVRISRIVPGMGEEALADSALIPPAVALDDAEWALRSGSMDCRASR